MPYIVDMSARDSLDDVRAVAQAVEEAPRGQNIPLVDLTGIRRPGVEVSDSLVPLDCVYRLTGTRR